MKKPMALVLSVDLVLLGTAPVMAAGAMAAPTQQGKAVGVVMPEGALEIGDEAIKDVQGKQWQGEAADILWGAVRGGLIAGGSYIAEKKLRHEKIDYKELVAKNALRCSHRANQRDDQCCAQDHRIWGKSRQVYPQRYEVGFQGCVRGNRPPVEQGDAQSGWRWTVVNGRLRLAVPPTAATNSGKEQNGP